jgi:hypothetical protein
MNYMVEKFGMLKSLSRITSWTLETLWKIMSMATKLSCNQSSKTTEFVIIVSWKYEKLINKMSFHLRN